MVGRASHKIPIRVIIMYQVFVDSKNLMQSRLFFFSNQISLWHPLASVRAVPNFLPSEWIPELQAAWKWLPVLHLLLSRDHLGKHSQFCCSKKGRLSFLSLILKGQVREFYVKVNYQISKIRTRKIQSTIVPKNIEMNILQQK